MPAITETAATPTGAEQLSELRRQADVLIDNGYPALAGMSDGEFRALTAPLETQLPDEPFVLVVTGALIRRTDSSR